MNSISSCNYFSKTCFSFAETTAKKVKICSRFLSSLLFGTTGSYQLLGIEINFEKINNPPFRFSQICNQSLISQIFSRTVGFFADNCLRSAPFRVLSLGYLHVLSHEMGHAMAFKAFTGGTPKITIFTDFGGGTTVSNSSFSRLGLSKWSIVSASGPLTHMFFSNCILAASLALRASNPLIASILGIGSAIWMTGELLYATRERGDFGSIAQNSHFHLALATIALVGECALGVFTAYKLL